MTEFQGHHTNQAYYKSGIVSSEYLSSLPYLDVLWGTWVL